MSDNTPDYLKKELDRLELKILKAKKLLSDPQLKDLAQEEIKVLVTQKQALLSSKNLKDNETELKKSSPQKRGSAIIEVRAAAGGEEAKIWAQDLFKMYTRFAYGQKFPVIVLNDGVIKIKDKKAYPLLRHEAGVHRVQRVPTTESSGRIHTSTATVAVLPEVKETEVSLNPNDLEISFFRSSGAGGQNVNKVSTAVRLKHKPTEMVIESQTQRTQIQNRNIAIEILRAKLFQLEEEKKLAQMGKDRSAIGRGMRAEKIRTYNFPQNRITDHRLNKSWKSLDRVMDGDLMPIVKALVNYSPTS